MKMKEFLFISVLSGNRIELKALRGAFQQHKNAKQTSAQFLTWMENIFLHIHKIGPIEATNKMMITKPRELQRIVSLTFLHERVTDD